MGKKTGVSTLAIPVKVGQCRPWNFWLKAATTAFTFKNLL